jgi:hypothetical protein
MSALRRDIPALALSVNVLLLVWMVFGRGLFVPLGWMMLFGVLASPILALCLWSTTQMMRKPPGRVLTTAQASAQLILWLAMFGFGFTLVDANDNPGGQSVLTKLLGGGSTTENVSNLLWLACSIVGVVAWIVLQNRLTADAAQARAQGIDRPD